MGSGANIQSSVHIGSWSVKGKNFSLIDTVSAQVVSSFVKKKLLGRG